MNEDDKTTLHMMMAVDFCESAIEDCSDVVEWGGSTAFPACLRLAREHALVFVGVRPSTVDAQLAKALVEVNHFCDAPDFMDHHFEPDYADPESVTKFLNAVQSATSSPKLLIETFEVVDDAFREFNRPAVGDHVAG